MFQKKYAVKLIVLFAFLLLFAACREKCTPRKKGPALFFIKADSSLHISTARMVLDNKDTFNLMNGGLVYYSTANSGASKLCSQVLYNELPLSKSQFTIIITTDNGKMAHILFTYKVYPVYNTCTDMVDYKIDNLAIKNLGQLLPNPIKVGFTSREPLTGFLHNNAFYQTYSDYVGIEIF
ncbi:MAG: hypothetical protein V4613_02540 [Bacteroidota bacterium]